jgi:hypothetical protein
MGFPFPIPAQQESWPTSDRLIEYGVLCKCAYSPTIQSTYIMRAVALRTVQKFRFLIYDYESYNYKIY